MNTQKVYGEWFDEQAIARAKRDGHGLKLSRALLKRGGFVVRGYIYTFPNGKTYGYNRTRSGKVKGTPFDLDKSQIICIESIVE